MKLKFIDVELDTLNVDVSQIEKAIGPRTRLIVVTNPNNPTGAAVSRADIMQVLEAAPHAAVLLDEAYFDFSGQTMLDQTGKIPNLFVARTFSKAYGLAGVRLGALAGDAAERENRRHSRRRPDRGISRADLQGARDESDRHQR